MPFSPSINAILIGGSAGSFGEVLKILEQLPASFNIPIFITMHRLKNIKSGFLEVLQPKCKLEVVEPEDKEIIKPNKV